MGPLLEITSTAHLISKLLNEVADSLDTSSGSGLLTVSSYDTAWLARLRLPENPAALAFPITLNWLLETQAANGGWSEPHPYSLLPTMAALLALKKAPVQTEGVISAARRAEIYLATTLPKWDISKHESVGFEVLAPGLLNELAELGLTFNFPHYHELMRLYHKKLAVATPEMLYVGTSNLLHSLEAFPRLDYTRLKALQSPDGSYGHSPAATVSALIFGSWDTKAYEYLSRLVGQYNGAVPAVFPIDAFELAWVLYNFGTAGYTRHDLPSYQLQPLLDWLKESLTAKGASISRVAGLPPDSDDTAMVILALQKFGVEISLDPLLNFERENCFACFETERDASLSANAHVLEALLSCPVSQVYRGSIDKVTKFLLANRDTAGYWQDKWHLSPYYATACSTLALAKHPANYALSLLQPTIEWLLQTQQTNGGWGCGGEPTLEETAYALQSLKVCSHFYHSSNLDAAIRQGQAYLQQHLSAYYLDNGKKLPKLWRGKELYTPSRVVFSVVLGAII